MLQGKKILVGVTGGIAAYKIPFLIRLLIRQGAEVKVVMTKSATDFVTPLTLSVVSQNPVSIFPFNESDGTWHNHIELGSWADAFLLAPLTANTMAKLAHGNTDNLLTAVYLASRCPVFFAPSMDVDMFNHPATRENILKLRSFGNILIEPREGELASGLTGFGRMEEPEQIVQILDNYFENRLSLKGKKMLVSAGPTLEAIDPVRFISNHSSGLMGKAIAMEAANRGASVDLVLGPVALKIEHPGIRVHKVVSAQEMYDACLRLFRDSDIAVMAAAVADYTPAEPSVEKIKKTGDELNLRLTRTKDILAELGRQKTAGQLLVGFALETSDEKENALHKLHTKNLDFIVLNSLKDQGAGFGTDTNKISILQKNGKVTDFGLKPKSGVAADILDEILNQFSR